MQKLIDYISRLNPDFPTVIQGATPSEIAMLENQVKHLVGRPLPPSYKSFLSCLGRNDGGLAIGCDATTNIDEVIGYYQNYLAKGKAKLPPNCILIAFGGVVVYELCLEFVNDREPRVVVSENDYILEVYAESLKKRLFQNAFMQYEHKRFKGSTLYGGTDIKRLMKPASEIALGLGFNQLWFSDAITFCGERADAIIKISQYERQGIAVRISGNARAAVKAMGNIFINQLGVKADTE
jgi:hypothetical protein